MSSDFTRRRLLKSVGAVASARVLLDSRERSSAAPPDETRPRVLALIGDRYHNADYIRVALNRLFQEMNLPIDYTINYDQISSRLLRPYRLFVVLRDGMIWPHGYLEPNDYEYSHDLENNKDWPKEQSEPWITKEQGAAIKDFVEAGGALYALHNSSHISLSSQDYREVMGGYILLQSENIDGLTDVAEGKDLGAKATAGWAYDFGKGRVVFTAVGHTLHAFWQPEYFKLQKNAVRWLLRTE
ncbi:MAG: hypothetical protein ABSG32_03440 [Terriglobia bacterium]